jgi:amino acid transporter
LSWLIGGGVALLLALVYAELGGMLPLAGADAKTAALLKSPA